MNEMENDIHIFSLNRLFEYIIEQYRTENICKLDTPQ